MEEYRNKLSENTPSKGSFWYASQGLAPTSSFYGRTNSSENYLQGHGFQLESSLSDRGVASEFAHQVVKNDASIQKNLKFSNPLITTHSEEDDINALKAKIISHPRYSNLLEAYTECQKVGAPPHVVAWLAATKEEFENRRGSPGTPKDDSKDPELDQFMEAYYDMLVKYREELARPLQEAMDFMRMVESELYTLSNVCPVKNFNSGEKFEDDGSSEEDRDNSRGETGLPGIDKQAGDQELKKHLLRKYSGYLGSLKQELSKKKKKGKLPKEARQKLLNWWELHNKWPYPTEMEKAALAESTGLDQKQINNWFINQRKRHWRPSEDMQFMVMDGLHPQNTALYMDGHYMGAGPYHPGP